MAVLRRDQARLHAYLRDWDLRYATAARALEPWRGEPLELPIHAIWARRPGQTAAWTCEFLLNEATADVWVYRRNGSVTRSLDRVGAERDGIPFMRPELVLLYMSTERSAKTDADFAAVRADLGETEREWLARAIAATDSGHRWLPHLRAAAR